jgi:hypothetical protein
VLAVADASGQIPHFTAEAKTPTVDEFGDSSREVKKIKRRDTEH